MTNVLDDIGYVNLVESWGSDERIIEAARMSTSKGFQGWGLFECKTCGGDGCSVGPMQYGAPPCKTCGGTGAVAGDEKLLKFLWTNKHLTPFEMAGLVIEMQLPIFVAREFIRHRTFSFNELSARYTTLPDLYYIPSIERVQHGKQATKNKQGSSTEQTFSEAEAEEIRSHISLATARCRASYEFLLDKGLARELARVVIPVNQYTRWRMQGNLRNWLQHLELRLAENTQWEAREYAKAVADIIKEQFPRTYALFAADL